MDKLMKSLVDLINELPYSSTDKENLYYDILDYVGVRYE